MIYKEIPGERLKLYRNKAIVADEPTLQGMLCLVLYPFEYPERDSGQDRDQTNLDRDILFFLLNRSNLCLKKMRKIWS